MEIKRSGGIGIKKGIGISKAGGITLHKKAEFPAADELNRSFEKVKSSIDDVERARADLAVAKNRTQENFGFWVAVYFVSEQQKDAFVEAMGWDTYGGQWVNGVAECRKKGLPLPEAPALEDPPLSKRWASLVRK